MKVWINNKVIDSKSAKVSVFDRGFLYGDGVFESARSYGGIVFGLDAHLARLKNSLRIVRIKPTYSDKELKKAIYSLLETNHLGDAYIRVNITRGEGRFAIGQFEEKFTPKVIIFAKPFVPYPKRIYEKGISAKVAAVRVNEHSPVSRIKSLGFLNNILARLEARKAGCDEAILMNTKGHIAEAATSNIFISRGSMLMTPSPASGILPGVTRKVVMGLAKAAGLKPEEGSISYSELTGSEEVFLTNSLFEVLPVVKIDGRKIGSGRVGGKTALLAALYKKLTKAA